VELGTSELEDLIGRVRPVSLAADRGGALYVADAERDRVLVFDYAGTFQRELGGFGERSGGFSGLSGVAVGARGTLVTVERPRLVTRRERRGAAAAPPAPASADSAVARARVQWLDAGGRVLATAWTPAWLAGPAEVSLAVAVDASGRVAVAGERSGELCVLSEKGELLARTSGLSAPRALAFADDGTLLVAESGAGRVRRFALEPAGGE